MTREEHLHTLGLALEASWADVEQAHGDLLRVWDPSRFGDDRHLQDVAQEKREDIERAFQALSDDPLLRARNADPAIAAAFRASSAGEPSSLPAVVPRRLGRKFQPVEAGELQDVMPSASTIFASALISILLGAALGQTLLGAKARRTESASTGIEQVEADRDEPAAPVPRALEPPRVIPVSGQTPPTPDIAANEPLATKAEAEERACSTDPSLCVTPVEVEAAAAVEGDLRPSGTVVEAPPLNYKRKDKMLVLIKDQHLQERIVNFTPDLIEQVVQCSVEGTRELLQQGADLNSTDERGDTALAWAVKAQCLPVVKLLLERGAEVNTLSRNGFSPYVWARTYHNEPIERVLELAGANTAQGSYWWRHDKDGAADWLKYSYDNYCRSHDCSEKSATRDASGTSRRSTESRRR